MLPCNVRAVGNVGNVWVVWVSPPKPLAFEFPAPPSESLPPLLTCQIRLEYSLVIVCLCPLTIFSGFIEKHGEKASRKIKCVHGAV